MIKIDLITGFLGSGKTTFIKKYAHHLLKQGYKIGIIENDYGAVNVDMMLLQDMMGEKCDLEMISGGCDQETHKRRFKTKLISMGMLGYDRILIEPSGIYDVDEFFDVLYEEPLNQWYEIGNVLTIVNAKLDNYLSQESNYLLASQVAHAGCVILSKSQNVSYKDIQKTIHDINQSLNAIQCQRQIKDEVISKSWEDFTEKDFEMILSCGYRNESYIKHCHDYSYQTLYFLNNHINKDDLKEMIHHIMNDLSCGQVFRIKGFIQVSQDEWIEMNVTHDHICIQPIKVGQEVIIIIGERLNEEKITEYLRNK